MTIDIKELNAFIVRAKASTYVGDGEHVTALLARITRLALHGCRVGLSR